VPNNKSVGIAFADPAINGGTVDATPIGGTTPAAGAFTTLTSTTLTSTTAPTTTDATGAVAGNGNAKLFILSTAITANVTTTSAASGSLGITTNATGLGKLFYADGTKWQFMAIS
jgi:hypothetical protein